MTARRLTFDSDGCRLVGDLHLPERAGSELRGAIVLAGPLTSVKEQSTGTYAASLARRGYAALAFDLRHFGESEGQPRQLEDPEVNVRDIRAAATALQDDDATRGLPIFGLGLCFGGGTMAVAVAGDDRFSAFAGVAGGYLDAERMREMLGDAFDAMVDRGVLAERQWMQTGKSEEIPAVAPDGGDVAMPLREAYEYYGTPRGAVPNYVNAFAVASFSHQLPFDVQPVALRIGVPFVMVHSEHAILVEEARSFFAAVPEPKTELWLESEGQIDFYDDPRLIDAAADAVADAFEQALAIG